MALEDTKMINAPYPSGTDCVWIAIDRDGHVAAFVTAGVGHIPRAALSSNRIAIEETENRICELPTRGSSHLLVSVPRPDDFIDIAQRGFFVYDWTDVHRPANKALNAYELVAKPLNAITLASLPDDLVGAAEEVRLKDIEFANRLTIDVERYLECEKPQRGTGTNG